MDLFRPRASANPMVWLLLGGCLLVALSLWLPWQTAARTARIEARADRIAELLLAAGRSAPPAEDPATRDLVLARFWRLAVAEGVRVEDVQAVEPPLPDTLLVLTNKHYAFQLAWSPLPADAIVARDAVPTREVLAWPLAAVGPAHAAFFHAEDAPRAYTRNLAAGYAGLGERRPPPGAGQRVGPTSLRRWSSYRSRSDERWILH